MGGTMPGAQGSGQGRIAGRIAGLFCLPGATGRANTPAPPLGNCLTRARKATEPPSACGSRRAQCGFNERSTIKGHPVRENGVVGDFFMSRIQFAVLFAAGLALAAPAAAETRIFVIKGTDGYGIDRCLAAGEPCGAAAAGALCRAREYAAAVNFGRLDQAEITGAVPDDARAARCQGRFCPEIVAITCSR